MVNTTIHKTFIRDFILKKSAISFAQTVNGEITLVYDWDNFHNCLIKIYRVAY